MSHYLSFSSAAYFSSSVLEFPTANKLFRIIKSDPKINWDNLLHSIPPLVRDYHWCDLWVLHIPQPVKYALNTPLLKGLSEVILDVSISRRRKGLLSW